MSINSLFGVASLFGATGLTGSSADSGFSITQTSSDPTKKTKSGGGSSLASAGEDGAVKNFLDYMKKPVAQRLRDAWLSSHNLTEKDLAAMSAADREAIEKQMAADLKSQMQQQAQAKATATSGTAPGLAKLLSASL